MNQPQPYFPQQAPPPPPGWQPPKQKLATWKKWAIGIGALVVLSAVFGQEGTPSPSTSSTPIVDTASDDVALDDSSLDEIEVGASDVVDVMVAGDPSIKGEFCSVADLLGYEMGLDSFKDGYGGSQNPSAAEVYDEFLTRC